MKRSHNELPDFVAIHQLYSSLPPGQRAELRRVSEPDDLSLTPALYRLFPGVRPDDRHRRVAFFLPWCKQAAGDIPDFSRQLMERHVTDTRILQVARAVSPLDLIQFRRVVMHTEPVVDWRKFGALLWFWGEKSKRTIVEDYYLAQFANSKGGK